MSDKKTTITLCDGGIGVLMQTVDHVIDIMEKQVEHAKRENAPASIIKASESGAKALLYLKVEIIASLIGERSPVGESDYKELLEKNNELVESLGGKTCFTFDELVGADGSQEPEADNVVKGNFTKH